MKNKLLNIALILLTLVFLLSAGMVAYHYITSYINESNFKKLAQLAPLPASDTPTHDDDTAAKEFLLSLRLKNPHTAAYLTIANTQVHYPVMLTENEPEFYLRRDFDTNYSYYGTPFLDTRTPSDGGVRVIYGHHIRGNRMFGELLNYNDYDFFNSHNKIHLYTSEGDEVYHVLAAVYTAGDDRDDIYTRAINGIYTEADYNAFVADIMGMATMSDKYLKPVFGNELLLLSTCEYSKEDGRYIVVAVKID